jgi:hypothetical protein
MKKEEVRFIQNLSHLFLEVTPPGQDLAPRASL